MLSTYIYIHNYPFSLPKNSYARLYSGFWVRGIPHRFLSWPFGLARSYIYVILYDDGLCRLKGAIPELSVTIDDCRVPIGYRLCVDDKPVLCSHLVLFCYEQTSWTTQNTSKDNVRESKGYGTI